MNKKIFVVCLIISGVIFPFLSQNCFAAGCSARLIEQSRILLENEFFQIIFEPQKAGRATSFIFLPWGLNITSKDGFFKDSFREIGEEGHLFAFGFQYPEYPYESEIILDSEQEAKVRISLKLDSIDKNYTGWILQREYSLRKGEPFVYVTLRMLNSGNEKRKFALRPSHLVHFENETVWYFIPDISGVIKDYDPPVGSDGRGSHGLFTMHPSGWWLGCIADRSQHGLVFEFEWRHLDSIETWISSRTGSIAQWFYRIFTLNPGQTWETRYVIYPVENLLTIDGASKGLVCSLTVGKNISAGKPVAKNELKQGSVIPVRLKLYSVSQRKLTYIISEKVSGVSKILKQGELEVPGFSTAEAELDWTVPGGDILAVLSARIMESGKEILSVEQPLEIGRNIEIYRARVPAEKQSGESAGYVHGKPPVPEEVQKIDMKFVSPHEKWAKPYAGGTTRMLFVYRNHVLVHLREILQRGDFEFSLLATTYDRPYEQMSEIPLRIKSFLPDVIFFTAFDWKTSFPPGILEIVKNWVYRGGGLVVDANLSSEASLPLLEFVKEGKEIKSPGFLSGSPFALPELKLYEVGKGRIVIIKGGTFSKGDMLPIGQWYPNPWMPGWEYNYPYLISAIYWAAHREMQVRFGSANLENDSFNITCSSEKPTGKKINVKIEIRNQYYQLYRTRQESIVLSNPETNINIAKISDLQEGISVFKVLASDEKGKILGWTSGKIEKPVTIMADISCDHKNNAYFKNEPVVLNVSIKPKDPDAKDIEGTLTIVDAWDRTVWKCESIRSDTAILIPDMDLVLDIWHQIILKIYRNGKLVSEKRQLLFIFQEKNPPEDDFSVGCWGHPYGNPSGAVVSTRSAVENGIDYFYSYGGEIARDHVYRNHGHIYGPPKVSENLFTSSRFKSRDPLTLKMEPSLYPSKEEWEKTKTDVINKATDFGKNLGANVMMLDDERDLKGDYDWSETTLVHFSEWLKKEYGTISELNKVWNRNYISFNDVLPERKENLKEDNLAPYIDFRRYIGWIVEEFYLRQPSLWVKQANPYGAVGMHGIYTTSSSRPWDMSKVIPLLSITGRYNGVLEEWFRGMGKNCIHGQYTGYDMGEKLTYENRITPWKNLFHGSRWILYYQMRNLIAPGGVFQSIINYDGTVREIYRALYREELKEIKEGIGKLVLNSKFLDDGIIFTYSHTSCLLNRHTSSYFAAKTLVQDIGYQHDLISYSQLETFQIPADARVLFLSDCISMSLGEIESIKKFVSSGGIVIADAQTAIYDQHGVKYKILPLDDVFGIDRSEMRYSPEKKIIISGNEKLEVWVSESGIKLSSGVSLWKTQNGDPVAIVNSYGKGKAIYLNIHLSPYCSIFGSGAAGEIVVEQPGAKEIEASYQKIFRKIFEEICHLQPRVRVLPQSNCKEIFLFAKKFEKSLLLGILPSPGIKDSAGISILMQDAKFVYDVREKKFLGSGKKVDCVIKSGKASLLALLPYKVEKITLNGPKICYQGNVVNFSGRIFTSTGFADSHTLRVRVFDGKGREIPFWAHSINAECCSFNFAVPVDLTMEQGTYKIVVTDVMTGTSASKFFKVCLKK